MPFLLVIDLQKNCDAFIEEHRRTLRERKQFIIFYYEEIINGNLLVYLRFLFKTS